MTKSTAKPKLRKPFPGFPLFPHATRRWAKKIRQKTHYFGKVADDPDGKQALEKLNREWPYLKDGRTPPAVDTGDGCTLRVLCNAFLTSKKNKLDSGELSARSFRDYYITCERLIEHFGRDRRVDDLRPDDFERLRKGMAKRYGAVTLKNEINRCRVVFKYASDNRLIDRAVHYGQSFNKPSAKILREARNEAGPRLFGADELRRVLNAADPAMRAMVLLGLNCGFGNTDVSSLPLVAVDLESGWINFPRPKTAIRRRIPLWVETVDALRTAIACRPKPKDRSDAELCFLTARGLPLVRTSPGRRVAERYVTINMVTRQFASLLKTLGINGRKGLGFYTLRHVFETVAGESRDQVSVNAIMGHVDSSMAGVYRERISDERLQTVVAVVHEWLFGQ